MVERKGQSQTMPTSSAFVSNVAANILAGVILVAVTSGNPLWIGAPVLAGLWYHYWTLLGYAGSRRGSAKHNRYLAFRALYLSGGRVGPFYERHLSSILDTVDRRIGDNDQSGDSALSRLIGLKAAYPQWTARSYDRCLLLALIYPILVIVIVWATFGHVGPAERALRLPVSASWWVRGVGLVGLLAVLLGWFKFMWTEGRARWAWLAVHVLSIVAVLAVGRAGPTSYLFAMAVDLAFISAFLITGKPAFVGAAANIGACSLAFALIAALDIAIAAGNGESLLAALFGAFAVGLAVSVVVAILLSRSVLRDKLGWFLAAWSFFVLFLALVSPAWLSSLPSWDSAGALLLFLVLLTIVNAPFDWIALGLTRVLLRRGLQAGGWLPIAYGVADLAAALIIIGFLSATALLAVQLLGTSLPWVGVDRSLKSIRFLKRLGTRTDVRHLNISGYTLCYFQR